MIKIRKFLVFVAALSLLISCRNSNSPDISNVNISINQKRLDKDMFEIDTIDIEKSVNSLRHKYGKFVDIYTAGILRLGRPNTPEYYLNIKSFLSDEAVNKVKHNVDSVYSDVSTIQQELVNAFSYYNYYFPEKNIPEIYTIISGVNQSVIVTDSVMAISLDKYLGSSNSLYKAMGFYDYQVQRMNAENILPDAMYTWIDTEFPARYTKEDMLTLALVKAKNYYVAHLMMPDIDKSTVLGFTEDEAEWCKHNEKQMWSFVIEHNILFNTNSIRVRSYLGNAPFTKDFGQKSPGRAFMWIAYDIVDRFMERNKSVTPDSLLKINDMHTILQRSAYRP